MVRLPFLPQGINSISLIVIFFLLSEIKYLSSIVTEIIGSIVYRITVIMIIATFLLWIASSHYHTLYKTVQMLVDQLFVRYFLIIYSFVCLRSLNGLKTIYLYTSIATLILFFFGVTNFITGYSEFVNDVGAGQLTNSVTENLGNKYSESDRFRVQAMFMNAFNYGYICIVLFFFHTYGFLKNIIPKYIYYIICTGTIFGVFASGCRTNIFCLLFSSTLFFFFSFYTKKRFDYNRLIIFVAFLVMYEFIPYVQEKIDFALFFLTNKTIETEGSSIEMRSLQFAAALEYLEQSPIWGNGHDYFDIDLGWAEDGYNTLKDDRLMGLEGVLLRLMVERGIVGIFFYYLFSIMVIYFFYKKKYVDEKTVALGISVFLSYFLFAHLTGELSSTIPTFLILGITMKLIYLEEENLKNKHE